MSRRALFVGINDYQHVGRLSGCVSDAEQLSAVLERNGDGSPNFDPMLQTCQTANITREKLRQDIGRLFAQPAEAALFYFSGHGFVDQATGSGFVIPQDAQSAADGFQFSEILRIASNSPVKHKILIFDCCYAGAVGNVDGDASEIGSGMTLLAASAEDEVAIETNGAGVFTSLLMDSLYGSAADLRGQITTASVYAHIDQTLGGWSQRPLYKANVSSFFAIRKVPPAITDTELRKLTGFFPDKSSAYKLDRSYEPNKNEFDLERLSYTVSEQNEDSFAVLQKFNRNRLVIPNDAEHMYDAAKNETSCSLTALGLHYWDLVNRGRI